MAAQADRYFARLVDYIYVRFPHSKPDTEASVQPRYKYVKVFLSIRSSRACAQIHDLVYADFRNPAN